MARKKGVDSWLHLRTCPVTSCPGQAAPRLDYSNLAISQRENQVQSYWQMEEIKMELTVDLYQICLCMCSQQILFIF